MRVLLLDPQNIIGPKLRDPVCSTLEVTIINHEHMGSPAVDSIRIDAVVAAGDYSNKPGLNERLLNWRTHPHTYLVPCWIGTDPEAFEKTCLWPRLAIDRFERTLEPEAFCDWLSKTAAWQQNRMQLPNNGSLARHSFLELVTCLALRRATGTLRIQADDGEDGTLLLQKGGLVSASTKHLHEEEAFHELLGWTQGSYHWESQEPSQGREGSSPLSVLIDQGLKLMRDANLLYHFIPTLDCILSRTDSESALDDGGVSFFQELKMIYGLIDGKTRISDILPASPLCRPRTMSCLAKWFSLGDVQVVPPPEEATEASPEQQGPLPEPQRLLIVDDSLLICRALESIFKRDERFQIVGVAHDGFEALTMLENQKPHVVTMDIQMPNMDGLTALKHIMIRSPTPVVVLSSFTKDTSQLTYESFKYGAVNVFTKPSRIGSSDLEKELEQLLEGVWQAGKVQMDPIQYIRRGRKGRPRREGATEARKSLSQMLETPVVTIACGTGGFSSLLKVLVSVPEGPLPFIFACMEMPRRVVNALTPNLNRDSILAVEELQPGIVLQQGTCYVYSHDDCFHLSKGEDRLEMRIHPDCSEHAAPFDHLFAGAAELFGTKTTAMLISGKGKDGTEGMRLVRGKGGACYVLSPEACLSPELPRRVLEEGNAVEVKSPARLASLLVSRSRLTG